MVSVDPVGGGLGEGGADDTPPPPPQPTIKNNPQTPAARLAAILDAISHLFQTIGETGFGDIVIA